LHDPFEVDLVATLQNGCNLHCKDLLLHGICHGASPHNVHSDLANGTDRWIGYYVAPQQSTCRYILTASHLPVVAGAVPNLTSVVADDAGGLRLLARHLVEKGRKRVLYRKSPHFFISAERRL
jgi:DNA-binding LacI/PurR family transcriptional regulator